MSELDDIRAEISELRDELGKAIALVRAHRRQQMVIEQYLEVLTSRLGWSKTDRRFAAWIPFWSFFYPLRVLHREQFSVWAQDALGQVIEDSRHKGQADPET